MKYFFGYIGHESSPQPARWTSDMIGGKFTPLSSVELTEQEWYGLSLTTFTKLVPYKACTQLHQEDASAIILGSVKRGEDNGQQINRTKETEDQTPPDEPDGEINGG